MSKTVTVYGIKSCDTMKKARLWLDAHGVSYTFHDYKALGISRDLLERWIKQVGLNVVINRAGTTFRALPEKAKDGLDAERAIDLMLAQPSMIKRPVLVVGDLVLVGFKPELYSKALD
jgi:Spx/MgsR family transcriptional regulator